MKNLLIAVLASLIAFSSQVEAKDSKNVKAKVEQQITQVKLNSASAEQLAKHLKGVGLKKAKAIVALREKLGGFKRVEQLLDVKGIGETTLEKNRKILKL